MPDIATATKVYAAACRAYADALIGQADELDPPTEATGEYCYIQVTKPDGTGRPLTYASPFPLVIGDYVELPALPWMRSSWVGRVISTERSDYTGEAREILGRA